MRCVKSQNLERRACAFPTSYPPSCRKMSLVANINLGEHDIEKQVNSGNVLELNVDQRHLDLQIRSRLP